MFMFEDCRVPVSDLIKILEEQSRETIGGLIDSDDINGNIPKLLKELEKTEQIIVEQALKIENKSIKGQLYLGIGYFRCKILELEYEMKAKEAIKDDIIKQIEEVKVDEKLERMFNRYKLITEVYRLYEKDEDSSLDEFNNALRLTLNNHFCDIEDGKLIGPNEDILPF